MGVKIIRVGILKLTGGVQQGPWPPPSQQGLTENHVFPIQPVALGAGDEELAAIGAGTAVGLQGKRRGGRWGGGGPLPRPFQALPPAWGREFKSFFTSPTPGALPQGSPKHAPIRISIPAVSHRRDPGGRLRANFRLFFTMESKPGAECFSLKFSSAKGPR